jgi:hypothetical protein
MNQREAIALLIACKPVIAAIDASGLGISFQPNAQQLAVLKGYEQVVTCDQARQSELWLDEVRLRAGLRPSDLGLLNGTLWQHYLRQPGVADEVLAHLKAYFGPNQQ